MTSGTYVFFSSMLYKKCNRKKHIQSPTALCRKKIWTCLKRGIFDFHTKKEIPNSLSTQFPFATAMASQPQSLHIGCIVWCQIQSPQFCSVHWSRRKISKPTPSSRTSKPKPTRTHAHSPHTNLNKIIFSAKRKMTKGTQIYTIYNILYYA